MCGGLCGVWDVGCVVAFGVWDVWGFRVCLGWFVVLVVCEACGGWRFQEGCEGFAGMFLVGGGA